MPSPGTFVVESPLMTVGSFDDTETAVGLIEGLSSEKESSGGD